MYYGIDFHVNKFTYHRISNRDGKLHRETKTLYLNELKTKFLPLLTKEDYVCIEALTGAFAFISIIKKYVKGVAVVNPFDFKAIFASGKKNDKIDAKKLANAFKYHIETYDPEDSFPKVYIPEIYTRELRSLFTTYNLLTKEIVRIKNRIHSILKDNLILWDKGSLFRGIDFDLIENFDLSDIYKIQIKILYENLLSTEKQKQEVRSVIIKHGIQFYEKEIRLLMGIDGISSFIACAIMADAADISRFKNANKFVSYMRCAPRLNASNDKLYNGKIDKKGRKLSFSLLLQGFQHIKKSNPNYSSFYDRKLNGKSKGIVRSALIRKTLKTIYFMLRDNKPYLYINSKNYKKKIAELGRIKKKLSIVNSAA